MKSSSETIQNGGLTRYALSNWPRYYVALMLTVICAIYLSNVLAYNFISDDAFITLRYSQHLAEGHGLVFNLNEHVEGFTSLLWTLLLSGMSFLGLDLLVAARSFGILFGLVTIILSYWLASASAGRPIPPLIAGVAPLMLALNGSFACWAASGMETMLYVCLVVASFLSVFSGKLLWSALLVMALLLTRPEGAAVFALLGMFQLLQYPQYKRMHLAMWFVACCGTLASLFAFRYLYYGNWLPNTYYAKTGGGFHQVNRGIQYFLEYAADHEGLVVLGALAVFGLCVSHAKSRFLALGAIGLWLATVFAGGDGLPMYRFALAPLPLLAVLLTLSIAEIHRNANHFPMHRRTLHILTIAALILLMITHATKPIVGPNFELYDFQKRVEIPCWTMVGNWLRDNAHKGDSVAAVPIGAVSYYSELTVLDMMGLTDKHIALRKMPNMGRGWAGHEKRDGQYILSRRPTYLLLGNIDITEQPRDPRQQPFIPYFNRAIWEREADMYETGLLATMYEPCSAEIAPGKYLNYYALRKEYRPTLGEK